jgi:hypothetical protein
MLQAQRSEQLHSVEREVRRMRHTTAILRAGTTAVQVAIVVLIGLIAFGVIR